MNAATLRAMRARACALAAIRAYFQGRAYLEVDTPLLAPALIPEAHLEAFATSRLPARAEDPAVPMFLVPSPELWMKRVLAAGSGSIFQLCRCFRNCEPEGPLHSPEFTMLEWYSVGADYRDSMAAAEELLGAVSAAVGAAVGAELAPPAVAGPDWRRPFLRLSMDEAFRRHLGTPLHRLQDDAAMRAALRERGLGAAPDDSWADCFHKLFLASVEPELPRDRPLFLYDYPAAVPTLARRRPGTPWAERWELYAGGVELANCYSEETDPERVREFFDSQARSKRGARVPHPPDEGLLRALRGGLPACSGAALGVDRLLMLLTGADSVSATGLFAPGEE